MGNDLHNTGHWSNRLRDWEQNGFGPEPALDGWDRLAQAMEKKKRRRPTFWWWGGGILLVGIIVWGITQLGTNEEERLNTAAISSDFYPLTKDEQLVDLYASNADILPKNKKYLTTVPADEAIQTAMPSIGKVVDQHQIIPLSEAEITENIIQKKEMPKPSSVKPLPTSELNQLNRVYTLPKLSLYEAPNMETSTIIPGSTEYYVVSTDVKSLPLQPLPEKDRALPEVGKGPLGIDKVSLAIGPWLGWSRPTIELEFPDEAIPFQSKTTQRVRTQGIGMHLKIGGHWGFQTGFSRETERSENQFFIPRYYRPEREIIDPTDARATLTYEMDVATSYTKTSTEIEVERPLSASVPTGFRLLFGMDVEESVKITRIPLLVTYDWAISGPFQIRLAAGPSWTNQRVQTDLSSRLTRVNGFRLRQTRLRSREQLIKDTYWTAMAGVALIYRPDQHWEIGLQPQWSRNLNQLSVDRNLHATYNRFHLQSHFFYRF